VRASVAQQELLIARLPTLPGGQRGLDRHEPFDLAAITDEVLLARRTQVERAGLRARAALATAPAYGDADLAERLVSNLIDNAIRHNLPGGHLHVSTHHPPGPT